MITVKIMTELDVRKKMPMMLSFMQSEYNYVDGSYFKYEVDDKEYFFNRKDDRVVVMWFDNDDFLSTTFLIDENYKVKVVESEDFLIDLRPSEIAYFDKKGPIQHSFFALNNPDGEVYNSYLAYTQWNVENNMRLSLLYNYMMNEDKKIIVSPSNIVMPNVVNITGCSLFYGKKNHLPFITQNYVLLKSVPSDPYYRYVSKNASSDEYGKMISRYVRSFVKGKYFYYAFECMKYFCDFLKYDDVKELIKNYGFYTSVPDEIVEITNEGIVDLDEFKDIAQVLKEYDELPTEQKNPKLVLELGNNYGNAKNCR